MYHSADKKLFFGFVVILSVLLVNGCSVVTEVLIFNNCRISACALYLPNITLKPGDSLNYAIGHIGTEEISNVTIIGTLPPGLKLESSQNNAVITGTVSDSAQKETFDFAIRVSNKFGSCAYNFTFNINPDAIGLSRIPPQIIQQDFGGDCAAEKLVFIPTLIAPHEFKWYIASGILPSEMTFDEETGEIYGEINEPFEFELAAEDLITGLKSPTRQSISADNYGYITIKPRFTGASKSDKSCFTSNDCQDNKICISTRVCLQGALNKDCDCVGSIKGTCVEYIATGAGIKTCSLTGHACGNIRGSNEPLCCQGLSCNNGVCEGPNGRCPYSINS